MDSRDALSESARHLQADRGGVNLVEPVVDRDRWERVSQRRE